MTPELEKLYDEHYEAFVDPQDDLQIAMEAAYGLGKQEAVRAFAEKLKKHAWDKTLMNGKKTQLVYVPVIDSLLNELTKEGKE